MKRSWPLAVCLACASTASSRQTTAPAAGPESFPAVVAVVNGTEISKADLLRRAEALKTQMPSSELGPDFYRQVLDDMVSGEVLYQKVVSEGLVPAEGEIDAELARQSERFGGVAAFESALAQQGLSIDAVKDDLKHELAIQKYVETKLIPELSVTEEEKRAFYDSNADAMRQPAQFRAAHILIQVASDASPEEKEAARTKAESLRSMIEMGQDFGELAARNSGDPGSKGNGGELPWMSQGQTVPPFEAAVSALEPGELSDVVETRFGYHIIKLLERRESGTLSYEEVEKRIEDYLMRISLQKRVEAKVDELKSRAKIEVFI